MEPPKTSNPFSLIMSYVLVVTPGRSGSTFLTNLINDNAHNAFSEHEANLVAGDVSTGWFYDGNADRLERLAAAKVRRLHRGELLARVPQGERIAHWLAASRLKTRFPRHPVRAVYVEVDNGALKSWGDALLDIVPDVRLVHLTRDPLLQAKSAENRGSGPSPHHPYFLWPTWDRNLVQLDQIVVDELSEFQLALWYWIEMDLRCTTLLATHDLEPALRIDVEELNDRTTVEALFFDLGIEHADLDFTASRNLGSQPSVISDGDLEQARRLLTRLPFDVVPQLSNPYGLADLLA